MEKKLFILVHVDESTLKEDHDVATEIGRIMQEERHILVSGNPCIVEYKVPSKHQLFVCGFYHGQQSWDHRCVDEHIKALRREGYEPVLHLPGTVSLGP